MRTVFLDIETTGLNPLKNEIMEVAAIVREDDPGKADREIHFSLPIVERLADAKALEINGYHDRRDELNAIQINRLEAAELLAPLKGALVVGNNIQFDLRFIELLISDAPWYYSPLDLKALVAGRCGMDKPASTKLIAEVAGVPLSKDAHTALVDARWNRDVYDAVTR